MYWQPTFLTYPIQRHIRSPALTCYSDAGVPRLMRLHQTFLEGQPGLPGGARLLEGKTATTHWEDIADLQAMFLDISVKENTRWVDEGSVITSAGISAGIDMSLHLVARLEGEEVARKTVRQMEFDWKFHS